jgi:hypothetical protein
MAAVNPAKPAPTTITRIPDSNGRPEEAILTEVDDLETAAQDLLKLEKY